MEEYCYMEQIGWGYGKKRITGKRIRLPVVQNSLFPSLQRVSSACESLFHFTRTLRPLTIFNPFCNKKKRWP